MVRAEADCSGDAAQLVDGLIGPYFRHEQTRAEADAIVLSGELWGGSPYNNGSTPAVIAYTHPCSATRGSQR